MEKIIPTPLVPISWGELIDKFTILEIKNEKILSPTALKNIKNESIQLQLIISKNNIISGKIKQLKNKLLEINKKLWVIEDDIRSKEFCKEFDEHFIFLARQVYILNDERAKIKKTINIELCSELVEEKSYQGF